MSKMSELDQAVTELRNAAIAINAAADALSILFSNTTDTVTDSQPEPKPLTLEQVRTVLVEKSRAGHTTEIRSLLQKHGADKLSEIDRAEYPALLAEVEELDNG